MKYVLFCLYILWTGRIHAQTVVTDTVEGRLGEDVNLKCGDDSISATGSVVTWEFSGGTQIVALNIAGTVSYTESENDFEYNTNKSLTVKSTDINDAVAYRCTDSFSATVDVTITLHLYADFSHVITFNPSEPSGGENLTVTAGQVTSVGTTSTTVTPSISVTDREVMPACPASGTCTFTAQSGKFPYTATATIGSLTASITISEKDGGGGGLSDGAIAGIAVAVGIAIIAIVIIAIVALVIKFGPGPSADRTS